jgi:hypothetical protein
MERIWEGAWDWEGHDRTFPTALENRLAQHNIFLTDRGNIAASKVQHRRAAISIDLSQRMADAFVCSPSDPKLCRLRPEETLAAGAYIVQGQREISERLQSVKERCEALYHRLSAKLRSPRVHRGGRRQRHRQALQRTKRAVFVTLVILFLSGTLLAGTAGVILSVYSLNAVKGFRTRLGIVETTLGKLGSYTEGQFANVFELLENLQNRTTVLEKRQDLADLERRLLSPLKTRALIEVREGISEAVYQHKIRDELVPSPELWDYVKAGLPAEQVNNSIYETNPSMLSLLSLFLATEADPMNETLSGLLGFPLLEHDDLFALLRPVHAGYFHDSLTWFMKPNMPPFIAVPLRVDADLDDIKYPDLSKCTEAMAGRYFICRREDLLTSPKAEHCPVPPTEHCPTSRKKTTDTFVHYQELDGPFVVATRRHVFEDENTDGVKSVRVVRKPIDIYLAEQGHRLRFGNVSLYGQVKITSHQPSWDMGLSSVSFPIPPPSANNYDWQISHYKFDLIKKQMIELTNTPTALVDLNHSTINTIAIVAALAVLLLLLFVAYCCCRGRKGKTATATTSDTAVTNNLTLNSFAGAAPPPAPDAAST